MGEEFLETDSDSETDDGDLDPSSDNLDNDAELKQSQLTLVNSTIEYGKNLELILSSNDVALAGENLILEINGTNHTLISDSTGKAYPYCLEVMNFLFITWEMIYMLLLIRHSH